MTTTIYIRARDPDNGRRLVDELLESGFDPARLHVYGRRLPTDLPVAATHWRSTPVAILPGAVAGAVLLPALIALAVPSGMPALLLVAVLGAAGGGLWSLARQRRRQRPLQAQRQALSDGEMLIAADVEQGQIGDMEARIAGRHPEMLVLGADAGGSPPFP
jgi:hypothetical protein